ncbi:unnamed protein product [Rotaria sordida]|uniref:Uncharacterized protein n=2 Tax=Rotaria sordida TaxID=392033 RepID=A0A814MQY3_9BILA|nr:unnamed protein product [Rotaria sordida]CAF1200354.1 unnamed protein product [Rotaria sordida]CAF1471825.1 unnamed protein product [Rotaria sordida]
MSIIMFLLFILLSINLIIPIKSIAVNRTYLIKKDFLSGLKGGEFTVYDSTGKTRQHRMESKFGITHDVRILTLPSKKLIARLKAKVTAAMYKATITILNSDSNQWTNGTIEQNFKLVGNKFTILWNGNRILMEGKAASLNTAFVEEPLGTVVAKFRKRVSSLFWRNKYDLQVLSNTYPDTLYLLGVAARDHSNLKIHRDIYKKKMSNDISSDVQYLIDQINETKNNKNLLEISYGNEKVNGNNHLTKEQTQQQPNIKINKQSQDNTYRTLIMIDPDAPSSDQPITGPFIHWILSNFQGNNGIDGQAICPYMGPGPRSGTGRHRYIFLLYQSTEQVKEEKKFDDIPQRRKFPLAKFVSDNCLQLLDVTFFTVDA